ncbi:MAG: FHA domain-containing protein [Chloroflexota bacterium]
MTLAVVLLLLRVLSAITLVALMATLFVVIWQDYRSAAIEVEASRRVYGYLVRLQEMDDDLIPTGEVYPLLPVTTLGRAPTNTIRLEDQFASSDHAVVVLRNGVWWLEDQESRNGTSLNGLDITQPVIVTNDDIINIGTLHFRIELERNS